MQEGSEKNVWKIDGEVRYDEDKDVNGNYIDNDEDVVLAANEDDDDDDDKHTILISIEYVVNSISSISIRKIDPGDISIIYREPNQPMYKRN